MRRRNHFSISFAVSFWLFFFVFENDIFMTFLLSFLVGLLSFLPDLDISFLKKIKELNRWSWFLLYPATLPFRVLFHHRTITHSVWLPMFFFVFAEFFFENVFVVYVLRIFYLAIFFHIIEDAFTRSGVRLFFPLEFKLRLGNFRVESGFDFLFLEILAFVILLGFFLFVFFIDFGLI